MTKILKNKTLKRWFSVFLAFLLVVTLTPAFQAAYGTDDDPQANDPALLQEDEAAISVSGSPQQELAGNLAPEAMNDIPASTENAPEPDTEGSTLAPQGTEGSSGETPDDPDGSITAQAEDDFWTADPADANKLSATIDGELTKSLMLGEGKTYTLTVNGALKGEVETDQPNSANTIYVPANTTLYLLGSGTVRGTGQGSVIVVAGGGKLVVGDSATGPTITGGTGSHLDMGTTDTSGINDDHIFYGNPNVGGGILVKRDANKQGATLEFNNGTVTSNNAQAGGGIYIDRDCTFSMSGGTVSHNSTVRAAADVVQDPKETRKNFQGPHTDINAAHEGGGIYLAAQNAQITKGTISNNTSQTVTDWGGGGIFVEVKGSLYLSSALVTSNTARGLGGGVSGCPHAKAGIGNFGGTSAIAIYSNQADGTNWPNNKWLDKLGKKGDYLAKKDAGFTADKAMDYYCTYVSVVDPQNYDTNETYSWKGRLAFQDGTNTDITLEPYDETRSEEFQGIAVEDATLGLTAAKPSNIPAESSYGVVIKDNTSWTHGGGIALNGRVTMGSTPPDSTVINDAWSIELTKQYKKMNGEPAALQGGEFTFGIYLDEDCTQPVMIDGKALTATNNASGKIIFQLQGYPTGKENALQQLYVKELIPAEKDKNEHIAYDESVHRVDVSLKEIKTSTNDPWKVTTTNYEATVEGYYVKDEQGQWTKSDVGKTFVNNVKPTGDEEFITNPWSLEFEKSFQSAHAQQNVFDLDGDKISAMNIPTQFTFGLYELSEGVTEDDLVTQEGTIDESKLTQIARASSVMEDNKKNKATFNFVSDKSADEGINDRIDATSYRSEEEGEAIFTFYVKEEVDDADPRIAYDKSWHKVQVTVKTVKSQRTEGEDTLTPIAWTTYTSSVADTDKQYLKQDADNNFNATDDAQLFTNIFHPEGEFVLNAQKNYYGATSADDAVGKFHFSMAAVNAPENNKLVLPNELEGQDAVNDEFTGDTAQVAFPKVAFKDDQLGDHWYVISETGSDIDGVELDPIQYVVKVNVGVAEDGMSLTSKITEVYYAEGVTETTGIFGDTARSLELMQIYAEGEGATPPTLEFSNFDTSQTMSVAGYSISAASNEPLEEVCFVDPKIVKNLEGRTLKADEFNFKLIHLNKWDNASDNEVNWQETEGPVISETSNDRYGMVDFDAANNVSGNWENPSCLSYTQPGIYHYRVVEANDTIDPSVDYSKQIITFTTEIVRNADGQLECKDMYYGYVDGNGYHRYTSKADDPTFEDSLNWHPTMTNKAKSMDLKVQKTSALDRNKGLEGATYGLYAVNEGAQGDILIDEQTSDAEGWITFEDVSLNTAATYYFKERLAPAGHTVSEFRSPYFKVAEGANGYSLVYLEGAAAQSEDAGIMTLAEDGDIADANEGITLVAEGVFDEATLVEFAKLDTRTHEWVEGADLSIIEKSTGKVVNNWKSGKAAERLEGKLNVDTEYILRENSAPEGYAKANDVVFTIDQYGSVRIISGTTKDSTGLKNAEIQDSTITLYDTMLDAEQVITETRGVPDDGSFLAKTGDFLKATGIVALAAVALFGLIWALRRGRKDQS